jgi:pyruvate dehydrogenase E2 component (dihydrolipoamide acetyltransferase)/2-oxoglutarate dehydrogenase E2 component (dihydrolipoamide succinyltransferase)
MAMKQGKVVEWRVEEGQWVEKGRILMVIETEKVTYECEAPASGFLHILVPLKETVPVFETVAWLADTAEELADLQAKAPAQGVTTTTPTAPSSADTRPKRPGKIRISPAARKRAEQLGVTIEKIQGTGPDGRIVREDVERAFAEKGAVSEPEEEVTLAEPEETMDGKRVKATIPLEGMRKTIADHMVRSLAVAAQLSTMGEMEMTAMMRLRSSLLEKEQEIGLRISMTDLLVLVLGKAVRQVPLVNASVIGGEIKIWEDIHVGVAVALDRGDYESGLIVPVVKNVERKTLLEISRDIRELTSRARAGKLTLEDVTGGTITLTNMGPFTTGYAVGTPILNQPQSVIVQTGGISDRPWVRHGELTVRPVMPVSITFDHRVLDGAPIGKFFGKMIELVENPDLLHF